MKRTIPIFLFITLFTVSSCTIFKKQIPKPVTVSYNQSEIYATLSSSAYNTKYLNLVSPGELVEGFVENFRSEGALTKNVTLVENSPNADFILKFKSLNVSESSKNEKINDPKSPYNGMEVVLNTVECCATFELLNTKTNTTSFLNCSNTKSRSEKIKNNRDLGDLVTGTNKDRTEYRTKLLSDRVCLNLAQDVGRRIWVPITRRIAKNLK
jgi:hypothetical protein